MAKVRNLQTHFQICYHITGEKLSPSRVNPLIVKFSELLKDFKIEKENYSAMVSFCGDFIFQEIDTRKVVASSHLTFEIIDSRLSNDINLWGLSHEDAAEIHNGLREISLIDGTYTRKVTFSVQDSHQGSEPPMSHPQSLWPDRRF